MSYKRRLGYFLMTRWLLGAEVEVFSCAVIGKFSWRTGERGGSARAAIVGKAFLSQRSTNPSQAHDVSCKNMSLKCFYGRHFSMFHTFPQALCLPCSPTFLKFPVRYRQHCAPPPPRHFLRARGFLKQYVFEHFFPKRNRTICKK